jgi:hypothetical protein
MRTIEVSIDVYAAIWAARQSGEETEDQILKRLLSIRAEAEHKKPNPMPKIGFRDARYNVEFPEGFEISRVYKGNEYRAKATKGMLELQNTGEAFPTLNKLSRAVSGNVENAWRNWYFIGRNGERHLIVGLRADSRPNFRHLM